MIGVSPAKINLFFRVIEKRSDGYHSIASLFQAISLFDEIEITLSEKDQFSTNVSYLSWEPSNLIYKALERFRVKTHLTDPISINLLKKIPVGAGLGGGSSNAATTLYLLNELFGKPLSLLELIQIGQMIGADVPFFFSSGSAYCTGVGEIMQEVDFVLQEPLHIVVPPFSLSTPLVYKNCIPGESSDQDPLSLLSQVKNGDILGSNDLEPAAFRLNPEMEEIKKSLLYYGDVTMTGSGSAFVLRGEKPSFLPKDFQIYTSSPIQKQSTERDWFSPLTKNPR